MYSFINKLYLEVGLIFLKNMQIAQTSKGITYKVDYVNL